MTEPTSSHAGRTPPPPDWGGGAAGAPHSPDDKPTYSSYLRIPQLLSLQRERSRPPHHDEMLFILSHQVYELWFRQMLHDATAITRYLDDDKPLRASHLLERQLAILHLLIEQIPLLETMFAVDFAAFRDNLRPASGFQSVQFRLVEFVYGAKNPRMLNLVEAAGPEHEQLTRALHAPTVYDHFLAHLARAGLPIPPEVLSRDTSQPHTESDGVTDALTHLYRNSESMYPQFRLAEHLLQFDERFSIWRFHHVKMVERMIGSKTGTGGSSGAKYLAATLTIRFFPEIWSVRDRLGGSYGAPHPAG